MAARKVGGKGWRRLRKSVLAFAVLLSVLCPGSSLAAPVHPSLPDPLHGFALNKACGTAVDGEGDIYVSNAGEGKIEVFDPAGNHLASIADASTPCGLAVDSKGRLYVSEKATGKVVRYLPDEYPLSSSPSYGSAQVIDSSGEAKGISVDPADDRLYVAEANRITSYQSDGTTGQDEVQQIYIQKGVTGGSFKLKFEGKETAPIEVKPAESKPTDKEIKEALEGLTTIGAGNVEVEEGSLGPRSHRITFVHALGSKNVPLLALDSSGLSGGVATLEPSTEGLAFNGHIGEGELSGGASAVAAYTYDSGEKSRHYLFVTDSSNKVKVISGTAIAKLKVNGEIDGKAVPDSEGCPNCAEGFGPLGAGLAADWASGHVFVYDKAHAVVDEFEASGHYLDQVHSSSFADAEPSGLAALPQRDEGQELRVEGASGGSFKLGFEGEETPPLAFNASAAQVRAALEALGGIGAGNVAVEGGGGSFRIRFKGALGDRNVAKLTTDDAGLAGSAGTIAFVNTLEPGYGPGRLYLSAGPGAGAKLFGFGPLADPSRTPLPALSHELATAQAVAVDSKGDVYAAAGAQIHVYDPSGVELTSFQDPNGVTDLDVDSTGKVYVLDSGTQEVTYYTPSKYPPTPATTYTRHEPPPAVLGDLPKGGGLLQGIGVSPGNDHFFVTDVADAIELGSAAEGSPILKKEVAAGLGIHSRLDVAARAANGYLYFPTNPSTIWVVDPAKGTHGEVVAKISGAGSPEGALGANPVVAVDQGSGHVVAFDNHRGTAQEFEETGAFVAEFGEFTKELVRSYRVAIDNGATSPNKGNVYVAFDDEKPETPDIWAFGPLSYGEPPIIHTGTASELGGGEATLNGTVDPRGFELTDCHFEYTTEEDFQANGFEGAEVETAPCVPGIAEIGKGFGPVAVHADIAGLDAEKRYRFRLVAENAFGTDLGDAGLFGRPVIESEQAQPVLYDEATLRAAIDPSGVATTYRFEYGLSEAYEHVTPAGEIAAGAGKTEVQAFLAGLEEGQTYHFRVVAENEAGLAKGIADVSFQTQERSRESCANAEFRSGLSANLPDCRAYELVTPGETNGAVIAAPGPHTTPSFGFNHWLTVPRGPGAGESLTYEAEPTLPGFEGTGFHDGYRAKRGPGAHPSGGWGSELLSFSHVQSGGGPSDWRGGSSDQQYSFWGSRPEVSFEGTLPEGVYLHIPGSIAPSACDPEPQPHFELLGCGDLGPDPEAVPQFLSPGGAHVIFSSKAHLEEAAAPEGTVAIYDREVGTGTAQILSVLPGGVKMTTGDNAIYVGATEDGSTSVFSAGGRLYVHTSIDGTVGVPDMSTGDTAHCLADPSNATLSYQWLRNGAIVGGANSPSYTAGAADVGMLLQCQVVATNIEGGGIATSKALAVAPFPDVAPPGQIDPPSISGTGEVGQMLTCNPGNWEGDPSFAYQWYRNGEPIGGATTSTYVLGGADAEAAVQCGVLATSTGGSVRAIAARVLVGTTLPRPGSDPTLIGSSTVGQTITCNNGAWSGNPTFAYQWLRNGSPIAGATAATYVVTVADEGDVLQCRVLASNAIGAAAAVSVGLVIPVKPSPPAPPSLTNNGSISGVLSVGQTITCNKGTWSGNPTFAYQWLRNGSPIAGATASSYAIEAADKRTVIECQITASNEGGSTIAMVVANPDPPVALASSGHPFAFAGIADDGSRLFYEKGDTLYALETNSGLVVKLAEEGIFVGASPDGSHAFFSSEEALTGAEENEAGQVAEAGQRNLYAWSGGATQFIAILDPEDFSEFGGNPVLNLQGWSAALTAGTTSGRGNVPTRATPDGGVFVFQSHARIGAYDNEGKGEIYRYDPAAAPGQRLLCLSCDPSGAPASADAMLEETPAFASNTPVEKKTLIPNVTEGGNRVFFQSSDRLVPGDANAARDVYEWKASGVGTCKRAAGCLALISSGQGEHDSYLFSMSADGHDVFVATLDRLLSADAVGSFSIYDARVEGGIPAGAEEETCHGDACQPPGPGQPGLDTPATSTESEGNVPKAPACSKGKHKVKGRCVAKKHRHAHRRKAHRSGRGKR